jgi:hypothetical protein
VPQEGILAKMARIQSLAAEMTRSGNRGKVQPRLFHRSHRAWKSRNRRGIPTFPSHDGGGYRLLLKTKPAKIAGPVRFLRRAEYARCPD